MDIIVLDERNGCGFILDPTIDQETNNTTLDLDSEWRKEDNVTI